LIRPAILFIGLIALLWHHQSGARESEWAQCGNILQLPPRPVFASSPVGEDETGLSADVANVQEGGLSILSGNVEVQRGTMQLKADHLTYREAEELIDIEGNVQFWDEGTYATGERAHLDLGADTTTLSTGSYIFLDTHSRGNAGEAVITGEKIVTLNDADYTTCNPGSNTWKLNAGELELDFAEDVGTAHDVWLEVGDVPVFYTPYATFPLSDKRKSGLLIPKVRISNSTGFDLTIPYYSSAACSCRASTAISPPAAEDSCPGNTCRTTGSSVVTGAHSTTSTAAASRHGGTPISTTAGPPTRITSRISGPISPSRARAF
jgi:lipopolysaccharide assembly outer membrane protein LptD (OstA)